jgi:hypothetical protein
MQIKQTFNEAYQKNADKIECKACGSSATTITLNQKGKYAAVCEKCSNAREQYQKEPPFVVTSEMKQALKPKDNCTCKSQDLFNYGCKCGYLRRGKGE